MPLSISTPVPARSSVPSSMPRPTTTKSHSMRRPRWVTTRSTRSAPSNAATVSSRISLASWSRWTPSITRPTSSPRTRRSGTLLRSTTTTSTPDCRSVHPDQDHPPVEALLTEGGCRPSPRQACTDDYERFGHQSLTSRLPLSARTPKLPTGTRAGPRSTSPLVTSNSEPWQGQITVVSSRSPSASEHPMCVQVSSKAWNAPPTLATVIWVPCTSNARISPSPKSPAPDTAANSAIAFNSFLSLVLSFTRYPMISDISSIYLIYLNKCCFPATVATESDRKGRCEYTLGPEVFREHAGADRHAAQTVQPHCRRARSGAGSHGQRRPRTPCRSRARQHRAAARFGAQQQWPRQACLRLRADPRGRRPVPEGLRTHP